MATGPGVMRSPSSSVEKSPTMVYCGEFDQAGKACCAEGWLYCFSNMYHGPFDEGFPHGKGEIQYQNGDRFSGNFAHGLPEKGTWVYANGDVFEGSVDADAKGTAWLKNGAKIEGSFRDGYLIVGTVTGADGTVTIFHDFDVVSPFFGTPTVPLFAAEEVVGRWYSGRNAAGKKIEIPCIGSCRWPDASKTRYVVPTAAALIIEWRWQVYLDHNGRVEEWQRECKFPEPPMVPQMRAQRAASIAPTEWPIRRVIREPNSASTIVTEDVLSGMEQLKRS